MGQVMCMDALALTTWVNTLASALAAQLNDDELALAAAVLVQLGDTLETIAVVRDIQRDQKDGSP